MLVGAFTARDPQRVAPHSMVTLILRMLEVSDQSPGGEDPVRFTAEQHSIAAFSSFEKPRFVPVCQNA